LSIALAIAMTAFGRQGLTVALLIALAYVIQIQSAAWYVRFVDKIFGKAAEKSAPEKDDRAEVKPVAEVTQLTMRQPFVDAPVLPEFRKILYATDLSETARHAVRYACSIGSRYGAEVTLLHIIPDMLEEFSTQAGINLAEAIAEKDWRDFHQKGIEKARQAIHQRIRETSRQVRQEIPQCPLAEESVTVKIGSPAAQIVSTAAEGGFDLIIMGTHGHGKLEEKIVGSIASEVIRQSDIPVLVVRLPVGRGHLHQPAKKPRMQYGNVAKVT
jgi:nucleotide-binding universal stress UspA family protein